MYYYEVDTLIDHGGKKKLLTYASDSPVLPGAVVEVPFGPKSTLGVVSSQVKKPDFKTKPFNKVVFETSLSQQWIDFVGWFRSFYPIMSQEVKNLFLPSYIKSFSETKSESKAAAKKPSLKLNDEQSAAVKAVVGSERPVILRGEMGSGKTLVYLETARKTLEKGRSVLILTPEIPLAAQLYKEARQFFKHETMLFNSNRTNKERALVWQRCLETTEPIVVIGTRSALFLPFKNLGLVCVDEFHESAYRQQESPHYSSVDVAAKLADLHGAKIVYGSATPTIKEFFIAEQKNYSVVRMVKQAASGTQKSLRTVGLVDQRNRDNFTKDPYISNQLLSEIEKALKSKKQALIFHNRRGSARSVMCENCGWSLHCEFCDINLIYHHDQHLCRCHVCGRTKNLPTNCPNCGGQDLFLKGVGVKALEDRLAQLFPSARIARFDSDNLKHENLASRLDELKDRRIDVIIGTQLVAKGLDLKDLSVVGVTNADASLQIPDYTSSERMFQLITQALGRVGRGHGDGVCIIQTYQPDNPIFKSLSRVDWQSFFETELLERQKFLYPPFIYLLKLSCRRKTDSGAEKAAEKLAQTIREDNSGIQIVGPSPAFTSRVGGLFQWQIVIKSKNRSRLLDIARGLPSNWTVEIDPVGLL